MKLIKGQIIMFMTVMLTAAMKIGAVHGGFQSGMTRLVSIQRGKRSGAEIAGAAVAGVSALVAVLKQVSSISKVTINMEIENQIKFPLKIKLLKSTDGDITIPPHDVQRCKTGNVVGRSNTASRGYVYWHIEGKDIYLIIYWEVSLLNSNRLGIKISQRRLWMTESLEMWFDRKSKDRLAKSVKTAEYKDIVEEVCEEIKDVRVCGTMGTGTNPSISIQVMSTTGADQCNDG